MLLRICPIDRKVWLERMKELIVDGYNIIYSGQLFKKLRPLEWAREKLKEILTAYADATDISVTIVYDGRKEKEDIIEGNPKVVFTRKGQSADSYIEKLVFEREEKSQIHVATDDILHQQLIFGMGGFYISAKKLKEEIEEKIGELRKKISDLNRQAKRWKRSWG